jgi:hypothetical protein
MHRGSARAYFPYSYGRKLADAGEHLFRLTNRTLVLIALLQPLLVLIQRQQANEDVVGRRRKACSERGGHS